MKKLTELHFTEIDENGETVYVECAKNDVQICLSGVYEEIPISGKCRSQELWTCAVLGLL